MIRRIAIALACLPAPALAAPSALLPEDPPALNPGLSVRADKVRLAWTQPLAHGHALRAARWQPDGLGPIETLASGSDWVVNWADTPTLLARADGAEALVLLQRRADGYGLRLQTRDGAAAPWQPAAGPHPQQGGEYGFASLWDWGEGEIGLAWLDGRDAATGGAMALRAARLAGDGRLRAEWVLDARSCDCCQTDAAMAADGPVLAYRDRSDSEVRDIAVVRWEGNGWQAPVRVHADDWAMPGCPVNGPALAAKGTSLAVAWYSGAEGREGVRLARSRDGGRSFAAPLAVARGGSVLGRVDVALDAADRAWVSWIEETADGSQHLRLGRYGSDGRHEREVAAIGRGRGTGFPRLAVAAQAVWLVWTDTRGGSPRIRGERFPLDASAD